MAFQALARQCECSENHTLHPEKKASKGGKTYIKTIASCCMYVCRRDKGLERILMDQILICTHNGNVKLTGMVSKGASTFFLLSQSFANEQFCSEIRLMFYNLHNTSLQNYTN